MVNRACLRQSGKRAGSAMNPHHLRHKSELAHNPPLARRDKLGLAVMALCPVLFAIKRLTELGPRRKAAPLKRNPAIPHNNW